MYTLRVILARQGSISNQTGPQLDGSARQTIANRVGNWLTAQNVNFNVLSNEVKNGEWLLSVEMDENYSIIANLIRKIAETNIFRGSFFVYDSKENLLAEASLTALHGLRGRVYPKPSYTDFGA